MTKNEIVVGLFGTCGNSTWRKSFIAKYEDLNITFFNPQVPDGTWHPGCVAEENAHLSNDDIILFPVLAETTGQGSLAEIGFSITSALSRNPDRYFVFLIDPNCTDSNATEAQRKDSERSRALVSSKLKDQAKINTGIFVVSSLDDMFSLSLHLYATVRDFKNLRTAYSSM